MTMPRLVAAVVLAVAMICGCSNESRPKTVPVSGQVMVRGKAIDGANLSFHLAGTPAETSIPSTAKSGADGTFRVSTFMPNDGMPPGEYIVTITWPERYTKIGEQEYPVGDRLGGAYAKKEQTPLRVTIRESETRLDPFDLKPR